MLKEITKYFSGVFGLDQFISWYSFF